MLDRAQRLRNFGQGAGDPIETVVRGGCHRSRWLRELSISADVTANIEAIYGIDIAPHPMPLSKPQRRCGLGRPTPPTAAADSLSPRGC